MPARWLQSTSLNGARASLSRRPLVVVATMLLPCRRLFLHENLRRRPELDVHLVHGLSYGFGLPYLFTEHFIGWATLTTTRASNLWLGWCGLRARHLERFDRDGIHTWTGPGPPSCLVLICVCMIRGGSEVKYPREEALGAMMLRDRAASLAPLTCLDEGEIICWRSKGRTEASAMDARNAQSRS